MQLTQMGGGGTEMTAANVVPKALPLSQRLELQREIWYHGPISRKEAECLLKQVSREFAQLQKKMWSWKQIIP